VAGDEQKVVEHIIGRATKPVVYLGDLLDQGSPHFWVGTQHLSRKLGVGHGLAEQLSGGSWPRSPRRYPPDSAPHRRYAV